MLWAAEAAPVKSENDAPVILPQRGLHIHGRRDAGDSPRRSSGSGVDQMAVLNGGAPCSCLGGGTSLSLGSSSFRALSYGGGMTRGNSYCSWFGTRSFGRLSDGGASSNLGGNGEKL
jgi:hypothetical protein